MSRIALAIAAAILGTGCVVSTSPSPAPCGTETLSIDWSFVDVNGVTGRTCAQAGILDVDVYVDGSLAASQVACTLYGVTLAGYAPGAHDVMVEGYDSLGAIVNRDWLTANQVSCGDSYYLAQPGEGQIEFLPAACSSGYLTYSLIDQTRAVPYVISSITTKSGDTTFPCASGVYFNVPYGYYDLDWIEERTSVGFLLYSKCADTLADVLTPGLHSTTVSLSGIAACH